jgi:hypothetical protein
MIVDAFYHRLLDHMTAMKRQQEKAANGPVYPVTDVVPVDLTDLTFKGGCDMSLAGPVLAMDASGFHDEARRGDMNLKTAGCIVGEPTIVAGTHRFLPSRVRLPIQPQSGRSDCSPAHIVFHIRQMADRFA